MNRREQRAAAKSRRLREPADPRALLAAATARHREGRLAEAVRGYDSVLRVRPEDPTALQLKGVALHQMGRSEEGIALARRAAALRPDDAETRNNLGMMLLESGRPGEAAAAFRRALESAPAQAILHSNLALALRRAGDAEAAVAAGRRAVALAPDLAEARLNLGLALADGGAVSEAEAELARAVDLDPRLAKGWSALGAARALLGRFEEAEAALARAIEISPGDAEARINRIALCRRRGDPGAAASAAREALAAVPGDARLMTAAAATYRDLGAYDEAEALLRRAIAAEPDLAEAHAALGLVHLAVNRVDEATAACRRAAAIAPDLPAAQVNLGICLLAEGDDAGGKACFRRALAADPGNVEALYNLVVSGAEEADGDLLSEIERRLGDPGLAPSEAAQLHFAAARLRDDAGDVDGAFDHYRRGNALRRAERRFDAGELERGIDRLIRVFDRAFFAERRAWGDPSERPVFVVGMPRSGTSLVEQILASHAQVHGAGELPEIGRLVASLPETVGSGAAYPEAVGEMDLATSRRVAARYLGALEALDGAAARVVDKMPSNFLHLGLIALLFPGARVVHCRRDPRDTCLSCYFQNFRNPQPFAYDLGDLAVYHRQYERLMAHWRAVLPIRIFDVRYEDLVGRQEETTRALVSAIGLDWDPACLAFHETDRPVLTASFAQVRRPIYSGSVGRWRRYAAHLGPLLDSLGDPAAEAEE